MNIHFANAALCAVCLVAPALHAANEPGDRDLLPPTSWPMLLPAVPTDEELESLGARIANIEVRIDDVFERSASLAMPYRVANGLHIATRPSAVRAQMPFGVGDLYSRRTLEEAERVLRASRYLNDASVEPVRYNEIDNTVDVIVRAHDVWTLSPGLSFGRKGGENSTKLKFEDSNFLGLGKQIAMSRTDEVDRSGWHFMYTDPNVLGSRWRLAGAYGSLSDGSEKLLEIGRPFYSLESRSSFNALAADAVTSQARYALGEVVEKFSMRVKRFDLSAGRSSGLQNGWVRRLLFGVHYEDRSFDALDGYPDVSMPDDRIVAYPWVGIEWVEDAYLETWNLDQIGRTEDLYLGTSARIEAGLASTTLSSTHDAVMLKGAFRTAADVGVDQYLVNSLQLSGRLEEGALRNGRLALESRYYLRRSPRRVFFAALNAAMAEHLDPEEQLLLGGDNGLRGYPLRYQAGTISALVTLEERFYTNWQPLKLFNVGAAVFFDAGRTWGRDDYGGESLGWLKDVGIGLRLGSARSGLGNVLHLDLAVPLDGGSGIDGLQFLIETRNSF